MSRKKATAAVPPPPLKKSAAAPAWNRAVVVDIATLKPHPRNYREHPEDQLEHIAESIRNHEVYRPVVVASDFTILAGHGVVKASMKLGLKELPVVRLPIAPDSPAALKLLAGDNEIGSLAQVNDRVLTELLKEVQQQDPDGLLGSGFDEKMLANLLFVTRPESEVKDLNEAAHWAGMPEYDEGGTPIKIVITFLNEADRKQFAQEHKLTIDKIAGLTWSTRWPFTEREDASSVRFDAPPPDGDGSA